MINQPATATTDIDPIRAAAIQCVADLGRAVRILQDQIVDDTPSVEVSATLCRLRLLIETVSHVMHADGRPIL